MGYPVCAHARTSLTSALHLPYIPRARFEVSDRMKTKTKSKKAKKTVAAPTSPPDYRAARLVGGLMRLGLSRETIAGKMAVSIDTVHRWLNSTHAPHRGALTRLRELAKAEALRVKALSPANGAK